MSLSPQPKVGDSSHESPGATGFTSTLIVVTTLAAVLLVFNGCKASWACGTDVSGCAATHHKNGIYRGEIRRADGHVATGPVPYIARFDSLRDEPPLRLATDSAGRFCIRWAEEGAPAIAPLGSFVHGRRVYADTPPSYWQPLNGRPPPRGCSNPTAAIPWNRARDLTSRPQYATTTALSVLPLILALLAVFVPGRWRYRVVAASGVACACAFIATATIWA